MFINPYVFRDKKHTSILFSWLLSRINIAGHQRPPCTKLVQKIKSSRFHQKIQSR